MGKKNGGNFHSMRTQLLAKYCSIALSCGVYSRMVFVAGFLNRGPVGTFVMSFMDGECVEQRGRERLPPPSPSRPPSSSQRSAQACRGPRPVSLALALKRRFSSLLGGTLVDAVRASISFSWPGIRTVVVCPAVRLREDRRIGSWKLRRGTVSGTA